MKKTIYYINPQTSEYLNSTVIDTRYFGNNIPNTTEIKPLDKREGYVVCFNKSTSKWNYQEDNRNKTAYNIQTKSGSKINYIGVIKDGFTLLVPDQFDEWEENKWMENTEKKELQNTLDIQLSTQKKINNLTKNYTSFEKDTFTTQETEARAWKADNTELTPFLDALCEARGVKKTIMIEKIISNADALKAPVAKIIGEYQKAIT
jgi:hypothetical protein